MRKIRLLTTAALIGSLLCGCAGSGVSKKDDDVPVITWYMSMPEAQCRDQAIIEEAANKIIEPAVGAKLKFCFFDFATFNQKMGVMISSGEEMDIMTTSSWQNNFNTNVRKGAFMDVSELLEKYGQDIIAKSDEGSFAPVTIDGKIYAIPSQTPWVNENVIVFKKDLVDKYNFDYKSVKSIRDLEPYLEKIKQNEPGITPFFAIADGNVSDPWPDKYESIAGGVVYNKDTKTFEEQYKCPELVEMSRVYYDFYQKGYIAKDASTKQDGVTECKTGKYAVLRGAGAYSEDGSKSSSVYGYPCYEVLTGLSKVTNTSMIGAMNAISSTSKHPEEAMKILNLIWKDPELSNLLAFGIRDVNYVVENEGTEDEIVVPKTGNEQRWGIAHNALGPLWDQWNATWNSTEALERMRQNNLDAERSELIGFFFDTEPVKTELAAISSISEEVKPVMRTGSMPDFDTYIDNLNKRYEDAGIARVKAEIERQYNEWKQNQK